jgi:molybdopterin/thiamine biosynthesis adenylyltransferase
VLENKNFADLVGCGKISLSPNFYTIRNHRTRNDHTTKVVIVGCGGTGGRTIPLVTQHIANHNLYIRTSNAYREKAFLKHEIGLIFVDGDEEGVELKNTLRQNFYQFDVGKKKAQIMAERMSALYGMDIEYYDCKYEDIPNFNQYSQYVANAIIFDHTDNLNARKSIEKNLIADNNVIISTGNKDTFGQCVYSCKKRQENRFMTYRDNIRALKGMIAENNYKNKRNVNFFPTFLELFRGFKDSEALPCVEMVLQNEQSMPVNNLMATIAYNMFYHVISGVPLDYYMVKGDINNTYSTNYITNPKNCLKVLYQGFFGVDTFEKSDEMFVKLFNIFSATTNVTNPESIFRECGIYSIQFIENYISNMNWRLNDSQKVGLFALQKELQQELNKQVGLE